LKTIVLCIAFTVASIGAAYFVTISVRKAEIASKSTSRQIKPTESDDVDEKLAKLKSIQDARTKKLHSQNIQIQRENMALENDIAALENRELPYPNLGPVRRHKRKSPQESALEGLDFAHLVMDCTDALLQKHNRLHPDRPRQEIGDLRKSMFGESGPLNADIACSKVDGMNQ